MSKEHLDLLPQLHRDDVLLGFGDVPGDLACAFMLFAATCRAAAGRVVGSLVDPEADPSKSRGDFFLAMSCS